MGVVLDRSAWCLRPCLVSQVPSDVMLVFPSCLACSEKGWRDCSRFRGPGALAATMFFVACAGRIVIIRNHSIVSRAL